MRNFGKLFYISIFFVSCNMSLLAANEGQSAFCSINPTDVFEKVYKSPIGTWEYTVEDVPYEYSAGVLIITKEKEINPKNFIDRTVVFVCMYYKHP